MLAPSGEWTDSCPDWRLLRLSKGAAYWLAEDGAKELSEGEVVVLAPSTKGCLRASQIGEVKFHCFHFQPELLTGFLSLAERHYFQTVATKAAPSPRFLAADHPAAQEFATLAVQPIVTNNLLVRCQLTHLVASIFADEMSRHQPEMAKSAAAQARFKQLINEMPEGDLLKYTPEQLAKLCGCSLRHFSRLFRKHFGTAIRVKQTELRLLKARQLLTDTDAKIIHIALESGYRHLGLFNSMFKKYLGMTPSEWRSKNLKKSRQQKISRAASVLVAAFLMVFSSRAAAAPADPPVPQRGPLPSAGRGPMQLAINDAAEAKTNAAPPQASATNAPAARATNIIILPPIDGYEIVGNTLLSYTDLEPIFKKYVGTAVTFDQLKAAIAELQMAYRNRGFVTVAVTLPAGQKLTNGLVQLKVTEGRLAEINVVNNHYFTSNNIMRALPSLQTNIFLNSLIFQRDLDRANGNRDRQIYPVIGPGPDPGTSALNLKVKDRLPLHGRLEFNNYSPPLTPDLRLNAALQYNNLWQLEHQIGIQYGFSPEEMKAEDQLPAFYDQPLVANYSAFYRMPLDFGRDKDRGRPADISQFGYDEVSKKFRAPPAADFPELIFFASRSYSDTGLQLERETTTQPPDFDTAGGLQVKNTTYTQTPTWNENLGFRVSEPLPGFWDIRSSFSGGLDYKSYRSHTTRLTVNSTLEAIPDGNGGFTILPVPNPIRPMITNLNKQAVNYLPVSLAWNASRPDPWGQSSFDMGLSFNIAGLLETDDSKAFHSAFGESGNYVVLTPGATREQKLYGDWALRLHADGQWANESLISNEQFGLGGQAGVRGYRDGESYGDTGWRVIIEPHTPLFKVPLWEESTLPTLVRFSLFTDYGERYLYHPIAGNAGSANMWGTGFSVSATRGEHFSLNLTVGVPLLDLGRMVDPTTFEVKTAVHAYNPRFSFSVSAQF